MDEVDYGDSKSYIRSLTRAVKSRKLDEAGLLEQLGKAARACRDLASEHTRAATSFMAAQCAYLAEVRERTSTRRGGRGTGASFSAWCEANDYTYTYAIELASIGSSPDPTAALDKMRTRLRKGASNHVKRLRQVAKGLRQNPLEVAKYAWEKLSRKQRLELLDWVISQPDAPAIAGAVRAAVKARHVASPL